MKLQALGHIPRLSTLPAALALVAIGVASCGGSDSTSADSTPVPKSACPAGFMPPPDMLTARLGGFGNPIFQRQKSGQVVSIPLPAQPAGTSSGNVIFSENTGAATPNPVKLEISISRCSGLIDAPSAPASPDYCTLNSSNGTFNNIVWIAKPVSVYTNASAAATVGYCWAAEPGESYFINARWTYASCGFGADNCGFAIQQNPGPL
jgi:hypothetical protein